MKKDTKGNPIFINKEVTDSVVIVEDRMPNMQDKIKEQDEQISDMQDAITELFTKILLTMQKQKGENLMSTFIVYRIKSLYMCKGIEAAQERYGAYGNYIVTE